MMTTCWCAKHLEQMGWNYGGIYLTCWWGRGGKRQLAGLISVYLPRAHIKSFIFKAAACFGVFFCLLPCNRQSHHGLLRRTAPCKADLFVLWRDLSAGQCFSFLCSLSVQSYQSEINALLAAHCCTKAMIDPSTVTMAIRSQTLVSAFNVILQYTILLFCYR